MLGVFELFVGRLFFVDLMLKVVRILKVFYDVDFLEEEVIL